MFWMPTFVGMTIVVTWKIRDSAPVFPSVTGNRRLKRQRGMFFADKNLFIKTIFQSSQYIVDVVRYIGCGFCTAARPCGIWELVENTPAE
jgi:hypothetical protein